MATDRQLFERLGKLIEAASKEGGRDNPDYRDYCFQQIWNKFCKIHKQIKTSTGDYYDPDGTYEEDIMAIYNAYKSRLWLIDVMDEVNGDTVVDPEVER